MFKTQLNRIRVKLELAAKADSARSVFGAKVHRYKLNNGTFIEDYELKKEIRVTKNKKSPPILRKCVILKNCLTFPAPSTEEASYKSFGICFKPARKITIEEPNCPLLYVPMAHN